MKENAEFILQFGSADDHLLGPAGVKEMRTVARELETHYIEYKNRVQMSHWLLPIIAAQVWLGFHLFSFW